LHPQPQLPKEGLGAVLILAHHPLGGGGPEPLKAEGHIFENSLQNKRYSAGCKLTLAAPGTSASILIIFRQMPTFDMDICNFCESDIGKLRPY